MIWHNSKGSTGLIHKTSHYLPTLPVTWTDRHHLSGGRERNPGEPYQVNMDTVDMDTENQDESVILIDF